MILLEIRNQNTMTVNLQKDKLSDFSFGNNLTMFLLNEANHLMLGKQQQIIGMMSPLEQVKRI